MPVGPRASPEDDVSRSASEQTAQDAPRLEHTDDDRGAGTRLLKKIIAASRRSRDRGEPVLFECPSLPGDLGTVDQTVSHDDGERHRMRVTVNFIDTSAEGSDRFSYLAEDVPQERRDVADHLLLKTAVEHTGESLVITEAELSPSGPRVVYVNPAFTALTGYASEEVMGKTLRILQGPQTDRAVLARLRRALREQESFRGEIVNYRKDGTSFVAEWHVAPVTDAHDRVTHWVATPHDVTERARTEKEVRRLHRELEARVRQREAELEKKSEELRQTKATAEAAASAKSVFLANMSHEIRTPLTAILGFASLLSRHGDEKHRRFASRIETAGERLMQTLNLVLELARLDAGQAPVDLDDVVVARAAAEVVHLFKSRARDQGLELRLNVAPAARTARARLDQGALASILNNLVGNAIKFTDEGTVTVHVELERDARPPQVALRVADTGVGIDEAFLPHLFNEFAQESAGQDRTHEGSGLGLSITRRLVELMDGTIDVTSAKGEGSTFSVRFAATHTPPIDEGKAPVSKRDAADESAAARSVLLVEDNYDTGFLMRTLLEDLAEVTLCSTAGEALEQADRHAYDLVLLDINLGSGRNGVDVLKTLRTRDDYRDTPIVAITAYAMPGDREHFLDLGFTDYIAKPFKVDDLLSLVLDLLGA